ncbi:hypothetical protein EDB19DRAFT_1918244 [Suillus lakei]|nr:hypothetical protein EDB19DRAFT_1918244 [Suillus lakei]
MPKGPSATWGVPWTIKDANGNIVLGPDGKPLKEKIPMAEARLPNGNPQSLYFPDGHPKAGFFRGMAKILVKCGYVDAPKLMQGFQVIQFPSNLTLSQSFEPPDPPVDQYCFRQNQWILYHSPLPLNASVLRLTHLRPLRLYQQL